LLVRFELGIIQYHLVYLFRVTYQHYCLAKFVFHVYVILTLRSGVCARLYLECIVIRVSRYGKVDGGCAMDIGYFDGLAASWKAAYLRGSKYIFGGRM
jgi:hypothetical protein